MLIATHNNSADFLLDGDEFYIELHRSLRALLAAGNGGNNCVRMSYWQLSPDTVLPAYGGVGGVAQTNMTDLLRLLARGGIVVQLIAWAGAWGLRRINAEMASNWAMNRWVTQTNQADVNLVGYRAMQMYMEVYGGRHVGCSTHQKITLVEYGATREAFIGGMNMAQKYRSTTIHDPQDYWHDTAVKVMGPVVDTIEAEWVRRWNKQPHFGLAPNGGSAGTTPGHLDITVMTTNLEVNPAETDIRVRMLQLITAATDLIYMEGYALTDPFLVGALAARVGEHTPPNIITVVNHPHNERQQAAFFSYMMFYTFMEMNLQRFHTIETVDFWRDWICRAPRTIQSNAAINRHIDKGAINANAMAAFNPVNRYRFNFTEGGVVRRMMFRYIWNITPQFNLMYAPKTVNAAHPNQWTYPHSKLALFDDNTVVIGTANWTYRSMQYDGEISLEIVDTVAGNPFATGVRTRLFQHWNQLANPHAWDAQARQNVTDLANGVVPAGETRIVPLGLTDFVYPGSWDSWKKFASTGGAVFSAYL